MSWSVEQELLATAVEVAYESYRAQLAIGGVKRGRIPRPMRIPRPTRPRPRPVVAPRPRVSEVDRIVALLNATHKRIGS